ncbi:hypothetical protein [Brenneria uluponensis]|uniref:hypothetical protein n=1 Tax=Brenneria uluponensis TaxID=3057057 RepID=UPI0028E818EB|nr:hypothetical protein [Brenneria ulupoensis]
MEQLERVRCQPKIIDLEYQVVGWRVVSRSVKIDTECQSLKVGANQQTIRTLLYFSQLDNFACLFCYGMPGCHQEASDLITNSDQKFDLFNKAVKLEKDGPFLLTTTHNL